MDRKPGYYWVKQAEHSEPEPAELVRLTQGDSTIYHYCSWRFFNGRVCYNEEELFQIGNRCVDAQESDIEKNKGAPLQGGR